MTVVVPTQRQYERLRMLGGGSAWMSAAKRDCEPLLRRGWVTADWRPPYYQFVRITSDGLRALALAVEKFGLPVVDGKTLSRVCSECGRSWRPACKCGCRSWRYDVREELVA